MRGEREDRAGPGAAVEESGGERDRTGRAEQAAVAGAPPACPVLDRPQGEEEERDPLDEDRERPERPGALEAPGGRERQRGKDERADPRVVVAAAGEMHGEKGFQPTRATANAFRRVARRPASSAAARAAAAASVL